MLAVSAALLAAAAAATARGGHAKDQAAAADALRPLFTLDVASAAFPSVQRVAGANALVVSQFTGNPLYSGTLAYVANISAAVDAALRGGGAPPPRSAASTAALMLATYASVPEYNGLPVNCDTTSAFAPATRCTLGNAALATSSVNSGRSASAAAAWSLA
mmetsp:Transcript_50116/g.123135  ORF Transcript_50116/g.123135 Transcript_50116/m.123135 type:complete len:161 (+) Transcript_50116:107-589(+)